MRSKPLICLALALLTLAIYWPARDYGIIYYDDPLFLTDNPEINAGITAHSLWWALSGVLVANWHPVTNLSFLLTHQFFGQDASAEHWLNLLLHAANAVLLFLALETLTAQRRRSAFVAALFAWHPLRVESVAWISERKDVLCGFFFLLALLYYARFARARLTGGNTFRSSNYLWSLFFFALALMSKPMAVSLPILLLLVDFWPLDRLRPGATRDRLVEKIPFFLLTLVFCVLTFEIQKHYAAMTSLDRLGVTDRLVHAVSGYAGYLEKFFWPTKLAVIYPYANVVDEMALWTAGLVLLAISVICLMQWSRRPYLLVGWGWYLIAAVPIIGLVQVGETAMADRYTYLPLIGPAIGLAWLFAERFERLSASRVVAPAAIACLLGACAVGARRQVDRWRDTVTLFGHTVAVTADNPAARYILGTGYEHAGRIDAALEQYRLAARLSPADPQPPAAIGHLLQQQGNFPEAIEQYQVVLQIKPHDEPAHLNLAQAFAQTGRTTDAIGQLETVLVDNPGSTEALNNLAWLLATSPDKQARDGARAVKLAEHACELAHHQNILFEGTLAAAYAEAGRFDDAIAAAEKAVALAEKNGDQKLAQRNRELLDRYRAHQTAEDK